jgi:hypothetical protein
MFIPHRKHKKSVKERAQTNRKVPQAYSPADDYAGSLTAFGMTID